MKEVYYFKFIGFATKTNIGSLLYKILIQDMNNTDLINPYYNIRFIENDYKELKILLSMVL